MKNLIICAGLLVLLIISGCKKDEIGVTPVTPTGNGIISGRITSLNSGNPLIQAIVTTNPATASVTTDIFGYYLIDNVKPGTYSVSASKVGYDSISTKITVIADASSTADIQLKLTVPGIIRGKVVNASNGSVIADANISTKPYVGAIKTDANGNYTVSNVKTGTYDITAEKFGFTTKTNTIVVVSDSIRVVDFVLNPLYGTLTGTVTDSNKVAIDGVNITTTPSTSSVLTDGTGKYTIINIPAGVLNISAKKGGWKESKIVVSITVGNNTNGDIILAK
jgi:hypothetical protein